MVIRKKHAPVHEDTLFAMDRALTLVGGSFVAAAKLVDMSPQRFRNILQRHAHLKAKWGKRPGFAGRGSILGFRIEPHFDDHVSVEAVQNCAEYLTAAERVELAAWLELRISLDEPVPQSCVAESPTNG